MKNDETVIDANMLVTKNTITQDQIEEVNIYLEYEEGSRLLSNLGYSFYYNLMQQNMHPADADRYANLNTILGYDVGKDIFMAIDGYVWEHDYDLLELSGSEEDKKSWRMQQKNYRCLWTFQNGKIYPASSMIICFLRKMYLMERKRQRTAINTKTIHLCGIMKLRIRVISIKLLLT